MRPAMPHDPALDHAGRAADSRPDITREVAELTDRVTALRVVSTMQREGRVNRLTEKLALAAGVAGRQTAKIEARADALIAREADIEKKTDGAFTPHEEILTQAESGLDLVEAKLRLMTNGGDPLLDYGNLSVEQGKLPG